MQNTNVVFTGPAIDRNGNPVLRADLKKQAERRGYRVQSSVCLDTEILVAGRFDTVKARKALERGLRVMSYPAFIDLLGGSVPRTGVKADPYVDNVVYDDPDAL